ncbi:MAG: insulinase family protein [Acidobacteriia bacterium]|nr:insulinase family protein [Terriglobia bacterium]
MRPLLSLFLLAFAASAQMRVVELPGKSPLVTFRIVFTTGSAADPAEKPGLAYLTAMMLANGGSRDMTYQQIVDAMFPMASSLHAQVDKEMTTFSGATHVDNLSEYYKLVRAMLLTPGWRADDFKRVKDDAVNFLRVGLRGNNDEELAKEVLYQDIFSGTPYGHYAVGTVSSLEKMTLDDVKSFYESQYSQANLILGIAGGYSPAFLASVKKDFRSSLPKGAGFRPREKYPPVVQASRAAIVEKDTRAVALSAGFPLVVTRSNPEFPALLVAASYLGQHRMSGGVLYDELREKRGLNYGDYAYIEYFPRGMFQFEPDPNLARRYQIFQLWIRPVEPQNAKFALRLALYELDKLIKEGIPQDAFERTRSFLTKNVNVLTRTKDAELGYDIDSIFYSTPYYNQYLKTALAKLTRDDVNRAIKRNLHTDRLVVVAVGKDGEELKKQFASDDPSPITYNSPKPEAVLAADKTVEKWPLNLKPENIKVVPVDQVFQ